MSIEAITNVLEVKSAMASKWSFCVAKQCDSDYFNVHFYKKMRQGRETEKT